jgi:hypothetical protein
VVRPPHGAKPGAIEELRSRGAGFLGEKSVEVRAVPVRVRDFVVRARRDEELVASVRGAGEGIPKPVAVESEAALQTARDGRFLPVPHADSGRIRERSTVAQFLQEEIWASGEDDSPMASAGAPRSITTTSA